jgi:GntR family transcriptional regulator
MARLSGRSKIRLYGHRPNIQEAAVPPIQRYSPAWRQIADHFKREILEGRMTTGDRLPSVRAVAASWGVSQGTAQQAYIHLHQAERLVRTDANGTYVDAPRAVIGPQQRVRLADAATQPVEVLSAAVVDTPAYVASLFGDAARATVIRRETVTRRPNGDPYMLAVSWVPPQFALPVPELLNAARLPSAKGAAALIAQRTDIEPGQSGAALEARPAKDDGRELPLLGLRRGAFVLAGIHVWTGDGEVIEYEEYVLPAGQVIEFELEP